MPYLMPVLRPLIVTRGRSAMTILTACLLLTGLVAASLQAQHSGGPDEIPQAELLNAGPLQDLAVGEQGAPVTIIEYASLTCGHCANFHTDVYPELATKYIDVGKVRFIMREFPLNARAYAASMISRCVGEGRSIPLIKGLFETQEDWAFKRTNDEFKQALYDFTKQAGLSQEEFNKCLADQKLLNDLTAQFKRASEEFGVDATPAFFINGKRLRGAPTLENFSANIDPLLERS